MDVFPILKICHEQRAVHFCGKYSTNRACVKECMHKLIVICRNKCRCATVILHDNGTPQTLPETTSLFGWIATKYSIAGNDHFLHVACRYTKCMWIYISQRTCTCTCTPTLEAILLNGEKNNFEIIIFPAPLHTLPCMYMYSTPI
jgi:hypothetical protein